MPNCSGKSVSQISQDRNMWYCDDAALTCRAAVQSAVRRSAAIYRQAAQIALHHPVQETLFRQQSVIAQCHNATKKTHADRQSVAPTNASYNHRQRASPFPFARSPSRFTCRCRSGQCLTSKQKVQRERDAIIANNQLNTQCQS